MQGEDDGRPGDDGHRRGEEDMATMASSQAGEATANNNGRARPPIDARRRRVERGMMAVQPAGSSTKIKRRKKNRFPYSVTFLPSPNSMSTEPSARDGTNGLYQVGRLVWALLYQGAGTNKPPPAVNGVSQLHHVDHQF